MQKFMKALVAIVLMVTVVCTVGCKKAKTPSVETTQTSNVTTTTATIGGFVTSDGGSDVIERGIYYGKNADTNVGTNVSNAGQGVGSFSCTLTNLQPATTYYARAYACNSVGVSYGAQVSFTTLAVGGSGETFTIEVSANPLQAGLVSGGGTFQEGEMCTVTATANIDYFFTSWTENYVVVSTETNYSFEVNDNRSLVANFTYNGGGGGGNAPTGAINGKFTINTSGDQVYFSQGNLQYIGSASTPYWKFADNQWDCFGTTTGQNSTNSNVDRDLFCWGTSGWISGANCYQPWSTSDAYSDYYPGGSYLNNLTGSCANADWGVYNCISNGGNQSGMWRTLTLAEWEFLLITRYTSSGIRYAKAQVNGVGGVILVPDDWNVTTFSLSNTNEGDASYTSNVVDEMVWQNTFEPAGAVFLPAAGFRRGTSVSEPLGLYWTATCAGPSGACVLYFYDLWLLTNGGHSRGTGLSVRLVCSAE